MPRFRHKETGSVISTDDGVGRQLGPEFELVVDAPKVEAPAVKAAAQRSRTRKTAR